MISLERRASVATRWGYVRLPGGDLQVLGREPDGSLDTEVLVLGTVDKVGGDYIEH